MEAFRMNPRFLDANLGEMQYSQALNIYSF